MFKDLASLTPLSIQSFKNLRETADHALKLLSETLIDILLENN
jgi:hypothetical protein